jgi:hypothetical protein
MKEIMASVDPALVSQMSESKDNFDSKLMPGD